MRGERTSHDPSGTGVAVGSGVGVLPGTVGSGVTVGAGVAVGGAAGDGNGDGTTVWTTAMDGSVPHATTKSATTIDSPQMNFTVDDATPVCSIFGLSIGD